MGFLSKLKGVDFFKKLPSDLVESSLTGASLSIVSTIVMVLLLVLEFTSFLSVKTQHRMVVDRSPMGELLRLNFNISFTAMTCEHLTMDVSDSLGSKKINLSKTVRKVPIKADLQRAGAAMRDEVMPMPKYDEEDSKALENIADVDVSIGMTGETFKAALAKYPVVMVNFYAPWCPWCQKLAPTWETVAQDLHTKYPEADGRIRVGKVDCVQNKKLCGDQFITGFPTVRVYRRGKDDVVVQGFHEHESYHGDRTVEALTRFGDSLATTAGNPRARVAGARKLSLAEGCQVSGFVLVKKVPGTLHFHMKAAGSSFDNAEVDISHTVHQFTFGNRPSPKRLKALARLHPGGLSDDWADKLKDATFKSLQVEATHEHFMQLILTTVEPAREGKFASYDAYEYTVQSHSYVREDGSIPASKFTYQTSPIQVVVEELPRQWYHFITTTCAIVGGVFTVCGILDGISYSTHRMLKKVELGKHS